MAEAKGIAFPSTSWGKQKTLVQCFTIVAVLLYVAISATAVRSDTALSYWLTIISTVISGLTYFLKAKQLINRSDLE